MRQEVEKLTRLTWKDLGWSDRLRKTRFLAPIAAGIWCLIGKGLFADGKPGLYYTLQRVVAECILSLRLLEKDIVAWRREAP